MKRFVHVGLDTFLRCKSITRPFQNMLKTEFSINSRIVANPEETNNTKSGILDSFDDEINKMLQNDLNISTRANALLESLKNKPDFKGVLDCFQELNVNHSSYETFNTHTSSLLYYVTKVAAQPQIPNAVAIGQSFHQLFHIINDALILNASRNIPNNIVLNNNYTFFILAVVLALENAIYYRLCTIPNIILSSNNSNSTNHKLTHLDRNKLELT